MGEGPRDANDNGVVCERNQLPILIKMKIKVFRSGQTKSQEETDSRPSVRNTGQTRAATATYPPKPGGTTTSKKILPRLPLLQTPSLATGKSRQNESEDPPEAVTARDAANARHHSAAGLVESRGGGVGLQKWDRGGRVQERGALFRDTNHCAMCA